MQILIGAILISFLAIGIMIGHIHIELYKIKKNLWETKTDFTKELEYLHELIIKKNLE